MQAQTRFEVIILWSYKHPALVIGCILLVTAFAMYSATRVEQDQAIEVWFMQDDPNLALYNDFTDKFHADEIIVIGVFADNVFDLQIWEAIDDIAASAAQLPYIHRVLSPTSLGLLNPYPEEGELSLREQALSSGILPGTFLSLEGDAAAIVLQLSREGNTFARKRQVVETLRTLLDKQDLPVSLTTKISGTPVTDDAAMRYNERDMLRIFPLMIALILGIAFFVFRHLITALIPLLIVLIATVWTFGLMGLFAFKFTLVSSALLPLILAVGVADSIHIITQYNRQLEMGKPHDTAVTTAVSRLLAPCFFTSVTTAAGLLALFVSDLAPIREFGVIAAFGVMAAFLVSIFVVTTTLGLLGERPRDACANIPQRALANVLIKLSAPSDRKTHATLVVSTVLFVVFMVLAFQAKVGIDLVSWYEKDDPVLLDTLAIDESFGGSIAVEFLVQTEPGGMRDPSVLNRLDDFERWLEDNTQITRVLSIVDILKDVGNRGQGDENRSPTLPRPAILNMLLDIMGDGFEGQWYDSNYSHGRLWARIPLMQAGKAIEEMPKIEEQIDLRFGKGDVQVTTTGYARLMAQMEKYILESQLKSLALAFIAVTVLIGLLLRSWRLAFLAMIPNLVPVTVGLGVMPLIGIGLNPGTVMVGAIVLGLVVDDTVHFLVAFRKKLRQGSDVDAALPETICEVGMPVVITSLILAFGFATLYFGEFGPSRDVGLVTAIVIAVALLADLVLLPAVLRKVQLPTTVSDRSP